MAFSGALVKKAADQTAANYVAGQIVAWDEEAFDVGGWHDNVTNNTRLTVPSGVTYVRITAQIAITSVTGLSNAFVYVIKNGDNNAATRHVNLPIVLEDTSSTSNYLNCMSGPIAVSAGDYFELVLDLTGDSSITVEDHSWFAIEALSNFSGALVKKSADQTAADYSTADVAITWDTDAIDVGGWHDTGSNTSRLTVPSGVSYVRLTGCVTITSIATNTQVFAWVTKDGDNVAATRHINLPIVHEYSDSLTQCINFMTGPLAVSAGAYFELRLLVSGDTSVTIEDYSWFAIEKIA